MPAGTGDASRRFCRSHFSSMKGCKAGLTPTYLAQHHQLGGLQGGKGAAPWPILKGGGGGLLRVNPSGARLVLGLQQSQEVTMSALNNVDSHQSGRVTPDPGLSSLGLSGALQNIYILW